MEENRPQIDQVTDNTQQMDAFGQSTLDQNNCASESQTVAENEASEAGEQGEKIAVGKMDGENSTQQAEDEM